MVTKKQMWVQWTGNKIVHVDHTLQYYVLRYTVTL